VLPIYVQGSRTEEGPIPRVRLIKSAIDNRPVLEKDTVYRDAGLPGFGVKVTPRGRKVFLVMYRVAGAGSRPANIRLGRMDVSPCRWHRLLKTLKTFFRWCVGRAVIDFSPAEGILSPYRDVSRDRVLTDQELAAVILAARRTPPPYGRIVEFLALTGQRREEVAQLTWEEIDEKTRTWTIPGSRTKNKRAHIVHLSEPAWKVIQA
jgi:integrase